MRRKLVLLPFVALALLLALGACSNEELMQEANPAITTGSGRTLSLTASMPEGPATRVALDQQADKSIALTWEVGDKLQLAFVQGTIKVKQKVILTADNITNEGKKALFDIELPALSTGFDDNANFDLYGVCGGGTKWLGVDLDVPGAGEAGGGGSLTQYYDGDALVLGDAGTNPYVQLPYHTGGAKSLETVHFRKDVMLTFASKGVDATNPQVSVMFNHLGSLFNITLKNTGTTSLENLNEAQLVGVNNPDNQNWAYNAGMGGKTYDLVTGKYQDIESGGNYLSLKSPTNTLAPGASTTLWAWYPPAPDKVWPELQLQLKDGTTPDAVTLAISVNSKPARTGATVAGKAYYFYAKHDGTNLNFTDDAFIFPLGPDEYYVAKMGTLATVLGENQATISKLILKGEINKADFDVMKEQMPELRYIDLSQVTCEGNKIPDRALYENRRISTIILPESITAIEEFAFNNCTGLKCSLKIPSSVTIIDQAAFRHCSSLKGSLDIPNGVTKIAKDAFYQCNSFEGTLTLPDGLTDISSGAFSSCYGFTGNLILPEGLTSIGEKAFYQCEKISGTIVFPSSLNYIGKEGFNNCKSVDAFQFLNASPIVYTSEMLYTGQPVKVPVKVPAGTVDTYTTTWGANASRHTITAAIE